MQMRMPSAAMIVALIALVMAVAGTGYAASKLAKNSVGTKQLKSNAVTSAKVKDGSLGAADFAGGSLPKGPAGPQGPRGPQGPAGAAGTAGRSALTPLQDGETVRGVIVLDSNATASGQDYATGESFPIPGSTGPTNYVVTGELGNGVCTGDAYAPSAPQDTLCVYVVEKANFETLNAGVAGDRNLGFDVRGTSQAAGDIYYQATWAFTEGPD